VVDLASGWKLADPFEITVRATNLTDEKSEALPVYASRGRAFHAGLSGQFQQWEVILLRTWSLQSMVYTVRSLTHRFSHDYAFTPHR
jgi:hypothetical protein